MKASWIILGGAAALWILNQQKRAGASSANMTGTPVADANLSGGSVIRGPWANTPPVDGTVAPNRIERTGNTNPLSAWLETTFGVRVPTISTLPVTSNASAPNMANQIAPAAPAGDWQGSNLGMPAVPGTWTPSTSSETPAGFVNLSDPNLLMVVMPWGDDVIYVPDPVLGI